MLSACDDRSRVHASARAAQVETTGASYVGRRRDHRGVGWPIRPSDDALYATAS
jgi:hypothetical protein